MIEINKMKKYLSNNVGKNISVIFIGSRNKKEIYKGTIQSVYNNIFTILTTDGFVKSINYKDILIKNVKIYV